MAATAKAAAAAARSKYAPFLSWSVGIALPGSRSRFEKALADELALVGAAGNGEMGAADVGDELVQHVEARHLLEDLDEAVGQVALVADEDESGVELHALAPRGPAFGGDVGAVVVGIGAPEN